MIHKYGPRLEHAPPDLVYVGHRWTMGGWDLPESPLANPYSKKYGSAEERVRLYREHLLRRPELLALLPKLRGKMLACWCKPGDPCHTDVLIDLIEE